MATREASRSKESSFGWNLPASGEFLTLTLMRVTLMRVEAP